MKTLQQEEYISIQQGSQQLRLEIYGGREYKAEKDEFYRQVNTQLEELDYEYYITSKRLNGIAWRRSFTTRPALLGPLFRMTRVAFFDFFLLS